MSTPDHWSNPYADLRDRRVTPLNADDRFPQASHRWSKSEIDALTFAAAVNRPLLIRGEPGCGKSQIARAAAAHCEAELLVEVAHPRFEAMDLLYTIDLIGRLANANSGDDTSMCDHVEMGTLWRAIEAVNVQDRARPVPVVLLDEIDKADADVPNSLLDVLGNRSFRNPYPKPNEPEMIRSRDGRMPLVVITTNEERELPAAFVRRCIVLNLNPPSDVPFVTWLEDRGNVHQHLVVSDEVRRLLAHQVEEDRSESERHVAPKVGLAEYIDLLHAVHELTAPIHDEAMRYKKQLEWAGTLTQYALVKGAAQDQGRQPIAELQTIGERFEQPEP